MTASSNLPPSTPEEKPQGQFPDAASTRALAEVSEALNGLRELASRVAPVAAKTAQDQPTLIPAPEEQLPLDLAKEASAEPKASVGVIAPSPVMAPPPLQPVAPARKPRVGETLRDARESAGFSLDEVAEEIKIKTVYLRAIEEGRYGDLPSRTYAVGWVRSYAQALGLHTEELVARCRHEVGALPKAVAPLVMREPVKDRRLPGGALMTVCVVLAVLAYAVSYSFLRPAATPASYAPVPPPEVAALPVPAAPVAVAPVPVPVPPPVAQAPAPEAAPSAAAAAPKLATPKAAPKKELTDEEAEEIADLDEQETSAPPVNAGKKPTIEVMPGVAPRGEDMNAPVASAAPVDPRAPVDIKPAAVKPPSRIKLHATADTEVRITDAQGRVMAERVIHKGESFYVPDRQHFTLATTDAGSLRVQVDGREMPALGDSGEAMHNIPLDPADLVQVLSP